MNTHRRLPCIVGITGAAGSGKDTLAAALVSHFGYTRRALADPIKELLNQRFGWSTADWNNREWKEAPAVSGIFHYMNSMGNKDPLLSPRQLAQWLGTEVGRDTFGPDVWVNKLVTDWQAAHRPMLVIPDVRFDNEARAIRNRGGVIVKLVRPGAVRVNSHSSEAGVSQLLVDLCVINDRDIESFITSSLRAFDEELIH